MIETIIAMLKHRWPTWLALACVVVVFADGETPLRPLAWLLPVMAMLYLVFGAARGQLRNTDVLWLQVAGLVVFAALALVALSVDEEFGRYLVAAGWLGHAAWDIAHHRANRVVPRAYAEWCAVFDLLGAAAILFLP